MNDPENWKIRQIDHRVLGDDAGRDTEDSWVSGIEIEDLPQAVFKELLVQAIIKVLLYVAAFLLGLFSGGLGFF